MTFTNTATLSYNESTVYSNLVTGEVVSPISMTKSASANEYVPNGQLQYTITIYNSSETAYSGLSLLDNLGSYTFMGFSRFPLSYIDNTAELNYYSSTGIVSGAVNVASSTDGITFTFDMPGNTVAILNYDVSTTIFAPLSAGSSIVNTAVLSGNAPRLPLTDSLTLPVAQRVDLEITKNASENPTIGQPFTFTFTVLNYGNIGISATDYVVISDQLNPALTDLVVYANGVLWTEGNQYVYDETLYYFQTQYGAIQLSAATFSQDDFGRWNTTPSSLVIQLTGNVSAAQPTQSIIDVIPAYTDGSEAFLNATKIQNDAFVLSGTGDVPAMFMITSNPKSETSLSILSDPRFTLANNILSINTDGLTQTATAYVQVNYGNGFVVQIDYEP